MSDQYQALLSDSKKRALAYLSHISARRVFPDEAACKGLANFDEALPEKGRDAHETLDLMDRAGSPATVASMGGRYFGFVVGGSLPVTVASNWLSSAWDQVASSNVSSPAVDHMEKVAARWVLDILDLPEDCGVGFVTGATMASFTALAAGRHHLLKNQGWDVEQDGLFGAPKIKVVVSDEVHVTILKAISMLGLGRNNVIRVPTDENGAIDISQLPELGPDTLVCVQAGNVNSGAFDPIGEICDIARASGAWVHVDGAIGLWARVSGEFSALTRGMEKADSWATDSHKWLNTPYDSGVVICRNKVPMYRSMSTTAAYLKDEEEAAKDIVPEFSRRGRGIDIWAALRTLGRNGVRQIIERNCSQARFFASELKGMGFDIHNEVVLNQIVVSFGSEDQTERLIGFMQEEGTCWFGPTIWRGKKAFRISLSSWKTNDEDIRLSIMAFKKARAVITEET